MQAVLRTSLVQVAVYSAASYLLNEIADGDGFWTVFFVLLGIRMAYSLIESVSVWIAWVAWNRKETIDSAVAQMRAADMPLRHYPDEELDSYLANVEGNEARTYPQRATALAMNLTSKMADYLGFFHSLRLKSALESALRIYSPSWKTPPVEGDASLERNCGAQGQSWGADER